MSQQIAYLEAIIGADITAFRRGMRDVRNDLGVLSDTVEGLGRLGRTMTFAVTAPLLGFGVAAVKAATDFDAVMRNVNSIARMSATSLDALSARTLEFGQTLRAGPTAAAESLYQVFSAGILDSERSFSIMETSAHVAEAGLANLESTTRAITATMQAYNFETDKAAHIGDVWSNMVALGVGSMDEFLVNSQKVLPLSKALGVSFEDLGATTAWLSQQGGGAQRAMVAIAMMESNLLKPTEALKNGYAALGVTTGPELIKKFGTITEAIKALRNEMSDTQFFKAFSKTGLEAALGLTNNIGLTEDAIKTFMGTIDGATELMRDEQLKSFAAQFDLMTSAAQGLSIAIGDILMPALTPVIGGITDLLNGVSRLDPTLLKIGVAFAGVAAAAGPVLWIISSLLNPFGLLLAGSAALATAIATDWGGIRTSIENAVNTALPAVTDLKNIVDQFFGILFADEKVIEPGFFAIDVAASEIPIHIEGSIWDAWSGELKEQFPDRAQFVEMATQALHEQHGLTPYQIPVGGIDLMLGGGTFVGGGDELYAQAMGFNRDPRDITTPFAERLTAAINNALPQLQVAMSSLFEQAKAFVLNEVFPTFDTLGGDLIRRISRGIFGGITDTEGKSPVYDAIRNLFSGGIGQAADEVGTLVQKHFPSVSAGLGELVNRMGTWLIDEGIPTFARGVGYFVGRVGALIGQGIASIPALLLGDAKGEGGLSATMAAFGETISDPFAEGFNDAMADVNITNPADSLVTSIAGWIGLALAAKLGMALIAKGVAGTIGSILSSLIGGPAVAGALTSGAAGKAGTGLAFSLGKTIGGAFSAAVTPIGLAASAAMVLVAGYLFNEDVRNTINNIGEQIADTLFGEGFTDRARADIQSALTPILEPFLRPFAEMQATANLTNPETLAMINTNPDIAASSQFGGAGAYDTGNFSTLLHNAQGTTQESVNSQLKELMGFTIDRARDSAMANFFPAATQAAAAGQAAVGASMENPIQALINALLPESPAGTAISTFVTDGLMLWQQFQDGTKEKTDLVASGLGAFALSAVNNLNPLKVMLDALNAAFTTMAANMALSGLPSAAPAQNSASSVGNNIIPASVVNSARNSGMGNSQTTNNVVVNGVQDVNALLYELKRRGVYL